MVVASAAGYPYFIQEYGLELWNHSEHSPITPTDVEEVRETVRDSLAATFFEPRLELATEAEQRYLAAMATIGEAPAQSADVARALGARDARSVSAYRDALLRKGLAWSPRRGQVDFTVPLFAEFLREHHPLATFED